MIAFSGQQTADGGRRTAYGGRQTADGGWRTVDSGRRTGHLSLVTRHLFIVLILLLLIASPSCKEDIGSIETEKRTNTLNIYCYNQFVASGLAEVVNPKFEEKYNCKIVLFTSEGNEDLLQKLIREKNAPIADIAIGIKNTQVYKTLDADIFQSYEPPNISAIRDRSLLIDKRYYLIPYAYSYFAFVYNSSFVSDPPKTFGAFQISTYKEKFMLLNPTTSATGYSFLLWTTYLYRERGIELFWNSIKDNIKSLQPNVDEVKHAFMYGDAHIILANSTYPAFYMEVDKNDKIKAFIPDEGGLKDIEYAGILRGSKNFVLAKLYMDFILTREFQEVVPATLWMYPVIEGINLPVSFALCPRPKADITDAIFDQKELFSEYMLNVWRRMLEKPNNPTQNRNIYRNLDPVPITDDDDEVYSDYNGDYE